MATPAGKDQDLLAMALVGCEAQKAKIDAPIRGIQPNSGIGVQGVQELQQMVRHRQNVL